MQLTKHTDYAFRVLIYLASLKGEKSTVQDIAEDFDISKNHLIKVVQKLSRHGWVKAIRGKNGGIYLATAPDLITLREVVELMEPNIAPVNCAVPPCRIQKVCKLKGLLNIARDAFLESLSKHTLADIVDKKTTDVIAIFL